MLALGLLLAVTVACGPPTPAGRATAPAPTVTPLDSAAAVPTPSPSRSPLVVLPPGLPPICAGRPTPTVGLIDPCWTLAGVVRGSAPGSVAVEPDYGQEQILGLVDLDRNGGRIRVDLAPGIAVPKPGDHILAVGPLVTLAGGARALAPAYQLDVLASPAPSVPAGVLAARTVWDQARAAWPIIPPAIIGEADVNGTAAAALYPDGIARVSVHTGESPDAHTIWHEAGHIYHAAALRARQRSAVLFTAQDEVGTAYWSARGLPGTWVESLVTGAWATTGYEVLAETFAAVNLGDAERASTAGIPLDRPRMRAFFVGQGG